MFSYFRNVVFISLCAVFPCLAQADVYRFSWAQPNWISVSGELEGTLHPDGNTVVVDKILSVTGNGTAWQPEIVVGCTQCHPILRPTVSLDGSAMDIVLGTSAGGAVRMFQINILYTGTGLVKFDGGGGMKAAVFDDGVWRIARKE